MADVAALPAIDEHAVVIDATTDRAWTALLEVVDGIGSRPAHAYARLVRCEPPAAAGPRPLTVGSTLPGFRVAAVVPGELLRLEGRHAFSDYALTFRVEPTGRQARVVAESRARFPGLHGRAYRALVIGTRGHVVAVRRLLARVRRLAEPPG